MCLCLNCFLPVDIWYTYFHSICHRGHIIIVMFYLSNQFLSFLLHFRSLRCLLLSLSIYSFLLLSSLSCVSILTLLVFLHAHRSGEGRTVPPSDWNRMRRNVAQLKMELDLVELSWSSVEEEDDTDMYNGTGPDVDEESPSSSSMPFSCTSSEQRCQSPEGDNEQRTSP